MHQLTGTIFQKSRFDLVTHLLETVTSDSPVGTQTDLLVDHAEDASVDDTLVE